ncbi:MAG: mechanosensitive ion channel domain-containing protein [Bacteroidota bacterium]
MDPIFFKPIETAVIVVAYFLVRLILFKVVNRTLKTKEINDNRGRMIKKVINVLLIMVCFSLIFLIWGVDQQELGVFVTSLFTIIGVAFFAQWSLLSNITSGVILFFNHNVRLHDKIAIMEGQDYLIEGTIKDIGVIFILLETDTGEEITLPNNIYIQKTIKKVS